MMFRLKAHVPAVTRRKKTLLFLLKSPLLSWHTSDYLSSRILLKIGFCSGLFCSFNNQIFTKSKVFLPVGKYVLQVSNNDYWN